ncbi:MAG: hypothetical protein IIW22_02585 [Erysipelotrichaceae bacterium]|nr:hypothetical protein [Erysipelotrichaceae bacterium]
MKKLLTVISVLLLLWGCTGEKKEETQDAADPSSLTVVTPKGAPVLAFYDWIASGNYSRVAADAIGVLWSGDESPDVITVDITSGVKAISNGADYRLAAVVTFGNLYIGATGNDGNDTMDSDDKIVLFGNENMLPAKVFHYLYGTDYDDAIVYVADAQQAAACLKKGADLEGNPVDYVFLAQPAMFAALKQNENASVAVDIQEAYRSKSGMDIVQAGVFIKNTVSDATAEAFLNDLEISINTGIEDPEKIFDALSVYEGDEFTTQFGLPNLNVVKAVFAQKNALGINAMGLGFKRARDIRNDIDAFLEVMGIEKTSEEIYR